MATSNTVSFQTPETDFDIEKQNLARQKQLAEALLVKGQSSDLKGQMIGNHYVAPSWTQQLAQALQAPLGAYQLSQIDKQAADLGNRQRQAYVDELTKFNELANGKPAVPGQAAQPEVQGNNPSAYIAPQEAQSGQLAVPGDRRAALAMALGAQNPMLQQYALKAMMPKESEWQLGERFNEKTGQPEKFFYDKNNPTNMQPVGGAQATKGVAINGQLVNPATGERIGQPVAPQASPGQPYYTAIPTANGVMAFNARTGQVEMPSGAPVIPASVDPALQRSLALSKSQGKSEVEQSIKGIEASKRTEQLLAGLDKAESLLKSAPTASGVGSLVDKAASAVGVSPQSAQTAAQLEALSGWLTANVPRMEGPQSDKDVLLYKTMGADVGNRTKPVAERLAALQVLRQLQQKYSAINQAAFQQISTNAGLPPGTPPGISPTIMPQRTQTPSGGVKFLGFE